MDQIYPIESALYSKLHDTSWDNDTQENQSCTIGGSGIDVIVLTLQIDKGIFMPGVVLKVIRCLDRLD
jgi:hypothetical protein